MQDLLTHRLSSLCLALLLAGGCVSTLTAQEQAQPSQPSLRPTHAKLVEKQSAGPVIRGKNIARVEPKQNPESAQKTEESESLVARSTVLSYAGYWTIVPKYAVIFVPKLYRGRVDTEPKGTLLAWDKFCYKNRGWIFSQSVSFSDATGETSLSEETLKLHKALGRVVVAVYQGGPISFQPPRNISSQAITKAEP